MYYIAHYQSPLGNITMASDGKSLVGLWFEGQKYYGAGVGLDCQVRPTLPIFSLTCCWLNEYFSSREPRFTPPILLLGSTFRQRVWNELLKIPYGSTLSYGVIAQRLAMAQPDVCVSARAVGGAVAHNPISLIVPCHRVVGGNGSLTGYAGGLEKKVQLLQMERSLASPALEEMRKDSSSKQFVDDFPFVKYH